jgi:hypothetical protein
LSACAQKEAPPQAAEPKIPFKPTASIQEIMLSVVDPSADALWESVAIIDPVDFASHAIALHDTAVAALKAIDAKGVEGLSDVGGPIDEACESCHMKYWYPNSAPPPSAVPDPPPFSSSEPPGD